MQCHYNLLYREDEREMIPVCRQFDMAITPYSPLASGHLCRPTWESQSTRSTTDKTMVNKYDHDRAIDMPIIERVAKRLPVTMCPCRKSPLLGTGHMALKLLL